jgi:hypothetical protein
MHEFPLTPTLSVSFQRYPYPPRGFLTALPSSWGALPIHADAPRHLTLPCPEGEAFWIGLVLAPNGGPTIVRVLASVAPSAWRDAIAGAPSDRPRPTDPADITVPTQHAVAGIARGDGTWWAFARDTGGTAAPPCRGMELLSRPGKATEPAHRQADPRRQHIGAAQGPSRRSSPPPTTPSETATGDVSSVRVDLVEPGEFQELSGARLPPLEAANRYGGQRLP